MNVFKFGSHVMHKYIYGCSRFQNPLTRAHRGCRCHISDLDACGELPHSCGGVAQAQRHLESQRGPRLKRKGLRLNILATGLPGLDINSFCEMMFTGVS